MSRADEYERQYRWRAWQQAYGALPPLAGQRVLDIGCAVGDQARDLASRGADVVAIDGDADLVAYARSRHRGVTFVAADARDPPIAGAFDGIWSSFAPAYFPSLVPVLARWRELLRPGGWIALTEMSGLFAHEPLSAKAKQLLEAHARDAFDANRYDFEMGRKLPDHLAAAGFDLESHQLLPDRELTFSGAAAADVLLAWSQRLARMPALRERAARVHPDFTREFLDCLVSPGHTTTCEVHFCLARRR
jgi:SAM-dependent methyltransferase